MSSGVANWQLAMLATKIDPDHIGAPASNRFHHIDLPLAFQLVHRDPSSAVPLYTHAQLKQTSLPLETQAQRSALHRRAGVARLKRDPSRAKAHQQGAISVGVAPGL